MEAEGQPLLSSPHTIVSDGRRMGEGIPAHVHPQADACDTDVSTRHVFESNEQDLIHRVRISTVHGNQPRGSHRSLQALPNTSLNKKQTYRNVSLSDDVPGIPISCILNLPPDRPKRQTRLRPVDEFPELLYGDPIIQKHPESTRVFFQNVKGLTHTASGDDYGYYMACMSAYQVDVFGLAETNTCWDHTHLRTDFQQLARKHFRQNRISFGSPAAAVDKCPDRESFQSGGCITMATGKAVSFSTGEVLRDPSGLGRWSGLTFLGKASTQLSIITAYRACSGSIKTAPLGSTFTREYEYHRSQGITNPNPRRLFFTDLGRFMSSLRSGGNGSHSFLVMFDANSDLHHDKHFLEFIHTQELLDLHSRDPAPSTYIGAKNRRIDYILGTERIASGSTRSGTLSYNEGPQSDHRGLYVDLDLPSIFDPHYEPPAHQTMDKRSLVSGNPEHVDQYNLMMNQYYDQHRMFDRMKELYETHQVLSTAELRERLNKWDQDQGRAMKSSEKSLKSFTAKAFAWSPTLRNSAIIRQYWRLRLRELDFGETWGRTFDRWTKQTQAQDASFSLPMRRMVLSREETSQLFTAASTAFRNCQRNSTDLRSQSYHDLMLSYEDDVDPSTKASSKRKLKIIRRTILSENQRRLHRSLGNIVKPTVHTPLNKILVPRYQDDLNLPHPSEMYNMIHHPTPREVVWDTIIDRTDMEQRLLSYNRDSFRAAADSPCGHGVIFDALTFTSLSPAATDVLRGVVPPEWYGDDLALKEFLASFCIPPAVIDKGPISTNITTDDVVKGFKTWSENTSTSPSNRHLGHYKALIQDARLLQCLTWFLQIVTSRGIAVSRWCNATNVLIEKDTGRPKIHRLRIIHLFEADYNFFLKLQWGHRLIRRADELNILHDGQYGSRPGRMAIEPVMLLQLTTDLCMVLKHNLARFDNDASACYDRIIVALAMLAARRCGMPEESVQTHADVLRLMKYTVKTVHGVSDENYSGTVFEPLFGTGQGSGASPAVWLSLVVVMLNTFERLIPERMHFVSPDGKITNSRVVDAFVDDTSIGFTDGSGSLELEGLISRLQEISQTWEHLLHLSGGSLNLKKCSWYVLTWDWKGGRPVIRNRHASDTEIKLRQGTSTEETTIRRMDLEEAPRILGVFISPTGDFSAHIQVLKTRADTFAVRLKSPRITVTDALLFHQTIYVPTMRYSLAAIAANEESLKPIQTNLMASLLQKMNVNSHLPTAIRHGPKLFGGLDLYDVQTEVGIEAIKFMRDSVFSDSPAGRLIVTNLQYSQREAGIPEPILEKPNIHIPYLTPTWVTSVRQYLSRHNLTITITNDGSQPIRGGDFPIMQDVHLQRYTLLQQRDLNLVRIYLQVYSLADMADDRSPTRINLDYLDGKRPPEWQECSRWPRQLLPSPSQRRLWNRFIKSSYLRYIPFWISAPTLGVSNTPCSSPMSEATNTSVSIKDHIKHLPRTERRMVEALELISDKPSGVDFFQSKKLVTIASDGGLQGTQGTFGWVVARKSKVVLRCSGPVDGSRDTASSTRSELWGYASSLLSLALVSRVWKCKYRCRFRWLVDSTAAISRVRKYLQWGHLKRGRQPPDVDILSIIWKYYKELGKKIRITWIKAHQDDHAALEKLSSSAKLNIMADQLATQYRRSGRHKSSETLDHQPGQKISISINGRKLTSQYDSSLRFHVNGYHLRQYIQTRRKWDDLTWDSVDFQLFELHFRRLRPSRQIAHMKFVHDQQPLGVRRYQQATIKDPVLSLCPCCHATKEDQRHLVCCPANQGRLTGWTQFRKEVLTKEDPHPLWYCLVAGIEHWTASPDSLYCPDMSSYGPHLREAITRAVASQNKIGWDNALRGFLSREWRVLASLDINDSCTVSDDKVNGRLRKAMISLYEYTRATWLHRNELLHTTESNALAVSIRSATISEIKHYHNHPHLLRFDDRHLCERPLTKLLDGSAATQRRWLRLVKKSIGISSTEGKTQTKMTSYFARRP